MDQIKTWYLQTMGVDVWQLKQTSNSSAALQSIDTVDLSNHTAEQTVTQLNWQELRAKVAACTLCDLHKGRTQTVFGVGSEQADLVIVGEAPGAEEDRLGEPFVGRAGKLLDEMLRAIGLHRSKIYIANILKCRPPNNRDPKPEEQQLCTPYLLRQLQLLQPKLILALGRISAQYLLKSNLSIAKMRNQLHSYSDQKIPLMVSYHPAYLLRNPTDKKKAYQDLLKLQKFLIKTHVNLMPAPNQL